MYFTRGRNGVLRGGPWFENWRHQSDICKSWLTQHAEGILQADPLRTISIQLVYGVSLVKTWANIVTETEKRGANVTLGISPDGIRQLSSQRESYTYHPFDVSGQGEPHRHSHAVYWLTWAVRLRTISREGKAERESDKENCQSGSHSVETLPNGVHLQNEALHWKEEDGNQAKDECKRPIDWLLELLLDVSSVLQQGT